MDVNDFIEALDSAAGYPKVRMRRGVVQSVGTSTVSVTIGGSSTVIDNVRFLHSYKPTVGDTVWISTDGSDLFIMGKQSTGPDSVPDPLPYLQEAGQATISLTTADVNKSVAVSFNTAFTVAPLVFVSIASGAGGTQKLIPRATGVSSSGCNVWVYSGTQTAMPQAADVVVNWYAIQMLSSAAAGGS